MISMANDPAPRVCPLGVVRAAGAPSVVVATTPSAAAPAPPAYSSPVGDEWSIDISDLKFDEVHVTLHFVLKCA